MVIIREYLTSISITGKKFQICIFLSINYHDNFILNFRIRRPIYNVLSTSWKNQIPMKSNSRVVSLNNRPILQQRAPTKDKLYSINKVPEYSPEYRPELVILPPTHREDVDDDKGPIHTIPAPNLSPADNPYNAATNLEDIADHRLYQSSDLNYHTPIQSKYQFSLRVIHPSHTFS